MELETRHALCKRNMTPRLHGILHEVRGVYATEGYGALNLHALKRAPRVMTHLSATWSTIKQSASSLFEADGRAHRCSPLNYGVGSFQTDCPILSMAEAVTHPHLHRGTVVRHKGRRYGEFAMPGFSDVAKPLELEATLLGEHNADVLRECGHNNKTNKLRCSKEGVLIEGGLTL